MVLRIPRGLQRLIGVVALVCVSCISRAPIQRLAQPTRIAVFVVHDRGTQLGDVPDEYVRQLRVPMDGRNLVPEFLDVRGKAEELRRVRDSGDRLRMLGALAGDAPLVLLVETRAEYYAQLGGRYRWTVFVKFSIARGDGLSDPDITTFDIPVTMSFDHEREPEVITASSGPVTRRLGKLFDDYLAGKGMPTREAAAGEPSRSETTGSDVADSIYFVLIDRFASGQPNAAGSVDLSDPQAFHGGDIAGLIGKLDYIRDLGFRHVWISPVFKARTGKINGHGAFHGYWTEDLRQVEPRFGTEAELVQLSRELKKRGMGLVMDVVLNHVGYESPLTREKPDWFHGHGDIKNWEDPKEVVLGDVHGLPDLAQEKPEVYQYLLDASSAWIDKLSLAGFRLDAVKHISNDFWKKYGTDLAQRTSDEFRSIGELYHGDPSRLIRGFEEGGFDALFDFPLYFAMVDFFCKGDDAGRLASILSLDRLYPDARRLVTFADNHDLPRVWTACGGERERVAALLTFMLTARGVPCVTYGTEAGLAGAGEPENRADMVFSKEAPLAELLRSLLAARARHPVFERGRSLLLQREKHRLSYLRTTASEAAVVAMNLDAEPWSLPLALPGSAAAALPETGIDLVTGETVSLASIVVPPRTTRVIRLEPREREGFAELTALLGSHSLRTVELLADRSAASGSQELRLVGGGPELGSWDPANGVRGRMRADGSWSFVVKLPERTTASFKLVRVSDAGVEWEATGNRYLDVDDAATPVVMRWQEQG